MDGRVHPCFVSFADYCGRVYRATLAGTGIPGMPRGSGKGSPGVHLNGKTPVQADPAYSLSASTAKPVRTFADASTNGTASTIVAFNSCSLGGRTVAQRPRST
jgi:hypothetical protein